MASVHLSLNRVSAIALGAAKGKVHFVTLRSGLVTVESLPVTRFVAEFPIVLQAYPVRRAARVYLQSPLEKTAPARRALAALLR